MEPVEGLMERLKLSAAEKKCIRIGASASARARLVDPQAIRKVLAEKLVNTDGLTQALGRIWCPMKGGMCKHLGENHFSLHLPPSIGEEEGPGGWPLDVREAKSIKEMEFKVITI